MKDGKKKKKLSKSRTEKTTTILRSKPIIEWPFYSLAMKCWRIQYYERGLTFVSSRESSLCIEHEDEMQRVAAFLHGVDSWEKWQKFLKRVEGIRKEFRGFCYVC